MLKKIKIGKKTITHKNPTYFIADIAANHDGDLKRAKKLIKLCAKAGANAAKFQHFKAETIVSDYAFKKLGKLTHQKKWKESIFQIYKKASINPNWDSALQKECKKYKIDYLTSPYDLEYVNKVKKYISAYKIGSGDITWHEIIKKIAKQNKPVILATGASKLKEVKDAVGLILRLNKNLILMQCNTNYTSDKSNYNYINLNVLKQYKKIFHKKIILGLSDHTFGHTTVLGAVTLGAKVIEKHFTDDNFRKGPDHYFSMNPITWKKMVEETRNLEASLGDGKKKVEKNEIQSSIVQRRGIKLEKNLKKGTVLKYEHLINLRPITKNGIEPYKLNKVVGKKLKQNVLKHQELSWKMID